MGERRRPTDRFDKFTQRARNVLDFASKESQRLGQDYIGPEHMLLGFALEGDGLGTRILINLGVELEKMRSAVEQKIKEESVFLPDQEIGITQKTKRVIETAVAEARYWQHNYIGSEHLLLGLIREGESIASRVLENSGLTLEKARSELTRLLAPAPEGSRSHIVEAVTMWLNFATRPDLEKGVQEKYSSSLRRLLEEALSEVEQGR